MGAGGAAAALVAGGLDVVVTTGAGAALEAAGGAGAGTGAGAGAGMEEQRFLVAGRTLSTGGEGG